MRHYIIISVIFTLLLGFKSQAQIRKANSILWEIRKSDSSQVSYVLGTIHIFDTSEYKLPMDTFKKLISRSGNLCVEINPYDIDYETLALKTMQSAKSDQNAKNSLDKNQYKRLVKILKDLGFKKPQIKHLTTKIGIGYLGMNLSILLISESSTQLSYPDFELLAYAHRAYHINTFSLETIDEQMNAINKQISNNNEFKQALIRLIDSFDFLKKNNSHSSSNNQYISQKFDFDNSDTGKISKDDSISQNIHDQRNINMANRIDSLYSLDKKLFVAIGIGHLFGNTGVLTLLEQKGYIIKPYKIDFIKK